MDKGKVLVLDTQNGNPDSCLIDCGGSEGDPHFGFDFHSGEWPDAVLEGVTIILHNAEGGYANQFVTDRNGQYQTSLLVDDNYYLSTQREPVPLARELWAGDNIFGGQDEKEETPPSTPSRRAMPSILGRGGSDATAARPDPFQFGVG